MPFEEFDDRIREAASNHHPAYDEKAWGNMQRKLDKHMPEEKDNRRRGLILFLFLLLGGSTAWLLYSKPWLSKNEVTAQQETVVMPAPGTQAVPVRDVNASGKKEEVDNVSAEKGSATSVTAEQDKPVLTNPSQPERTIQSQPATKGLPADTRLSEPRKDRRAIGPSAPGTGVHQAVHKSGKNQGRLTAMVKKPSVKTSPAADKKDKDVPVSRFDQPETFTDLPAAPVTVEEKQPEKISTPAAGLVTDGAEKERAAQQPVDSSEKKQPVISPDIQTTRSSKNKKKPVVLVAVSGGMDASGVGYDRLGKSSFTYGIGAGVLVRNRLLIRSGFYVADKLYAADSADYNPPSGWWRYYPGMRNIDADCKVYEIPLLLSYRFGEKKKHSWLATAGLSSVYMKQETYTYHYTYWNLPVSKTIQFKDNSRHFLSVLTLSGGYMWQPGSRFSLMAEPYLKMPLSGIGFGKIKLNSAGVLFSLAYAPFAKK